MAPSDPGLRLATVALGPTDSIQAWRALAAGHRPWLLASAGLHPEARQSIIAFDPYAELEVVGDAATWRVLEGDRWQTVRSGPALAMMRAFAAAVPQTEGTDGFAGGLAGWVGFEAARLWYPHLPEPLPRETPDVLWRLFSGACTITDGDATLLHLDGQAALDEAAACLQEHAPGAQDPALPNPNGRHIAWETSLDEASFQAAVATICDLIQVGDIFQANLATRFQRRGDADAAAVLGRLLAANPSPYMALLRRGGLTIVSGSPELLFEVSGDTIAARPIAGTRKRHSDPELDAASATDLATDAKEQAEHIMLVDLVRNDIARVSVPGTVRVTESMSIERYRHVMHLASRVEGAVRPGSGLVDWLGALFPGGTITGAPKERATRRIMEREPVARGLYTGSVGYLSTNGRSAWNILIRTLVAQGGTVSVHAGSGIVADSDAAREWREAGRKAQALLDAAFHEVSGGSTMGLGAVERRGGWVPPAPGGIPRDARVLLVDNEDSFVHNLADYCAAAGADVLVVDHREDVWARLAAWSPTHVVLGPGPGRPEDAPATMELAGRLVGRLPVLGVCLGHQALAAASGAQVVVGAPVHGKVAKVLHADVPGSLLRGLPNPLHATRYHSLVVAPGTLPPQWAVDAWLPDGTVMAIRHREHQAFGLQFHPESFCTPQGMEMIDRFLACTAGLPETVALQRAVRA